MKDIPTAHIYAMRHQLISTKAHRKTKWKMAQSTIEAESNEVVP
jgi:hypothetical protein